MKPFDFLITFFSFVYSLGLAHILMGVVRMVRRRDTLIFSWAQALWMLDALILLFANWISLWDFHETTTLTLPMIASGAVIVVTQYFVCAFVTPDVRDGEPVDLRAFHAREGRVYMSAFLALALVALVTNAAAGSGLGIQNWANQNALVIGVTAVVLAGIFIRNAAVQVIAPLAVGAASVAFLILYYPVLK